MGVLNILKRVPYQIFCTLITLHVVRNLHCARKVNLFRI